MRLIRATSLLAIVTICIAAPGARAATVKIGSPLTGSLILGGVGPSPLTFANVFLPSGTIASPVDGTLTSWSFAGNVGFSFSPRIVRSTGGIAFTGAGSGAAVPGTGAIAGPFATNLPVKAGDLLGVDPQSGSQLGVLLVAGAEYTHWDPPLVDGAAGRVPNGAFSNGSEIAVAGVVRYCLVPALLGLTRTAATQALTAADCKLGAFFGQKRRAKRTKRKPVVRSQSVPAGASISDSEPVDLILGAKGRKKR